MLAIQNIGFKKRGGGVEEADILETQCQVTLWGEYTWNFEN